jgi:hypothetical protein
MRGAGMRGRGPRGPRTRRPFPWLALLISANVMALAALVAVVFAIQPWGRIGQDDPAASPTPSPRDLMVMGAAHIPTSNSCLLCHLSGGEAGLKPVPALGHQLEGWTGCHTCHTNEKLGRQALGHAGIEETECLGCHVEAPVGPPITQAHSRLEQPCLDCHGDFAHLPSSMVGRNQDECWLCHQPAPEQPPQKPHAYDDRLTCRDCHQSIDVGALPINHALRADDTCLLCHDIGFEPALRRPRPAPPGS